MRDTTETLNENQPCAPNPPGPAPGSEAQDLEALATTVTIAEQIDLAAYKDGAEELEPAAVETVERKLAPCREAMAKANRLDGKVRKERAKAIAAAFELVGELHQRPEIIWAMVARNGDKLTERTVKSPCLAAVRAIFPELDRREQSALAQLCNHALACQWSPEDLRREIEATGTVEIVRRERQRQRLRAGGGETADSGAVVERYRAEGEAFSLSDISPPADSPAQGLALLLVGVVDGAFVAYDLDDNEKRVLAAVKHCAKRGRELRIRPSANATPETNA